METKITKEEIRREVKRLQEIGVGADEIDVGLIKRAILVERLKEGIKRVKKGDIIYCFNPYTRDLESDKEYVVYGVGKSYVFGGGDIIINEAGGYIAGGLDGRAVKKEDWIQYIKALKSKRL